MATLFVRKLLLWPRFHATVGQCLAVSQPDVEELSVPMSTRAAGMQQALLEAMEVTGEGGEGARSTLRAIRGGGCGAGSRAS